MEKGNEETKDTDTDTEELCPQHVTLGISISPTERVKGRRQDQTGLSLDVPISAHDGTYSVYPRSDQ